MLVLQGSTKAGRIYGPDVVDDVHGVDVWMANHLTAVLLCPFLVT